MSDRNGEDLVMMFASTPLPCTKNAEQQSEVSSRIESRLGGPTCHPSEIATGYGSLDQKKKNLHTIKSLQGCKLLPYLLMNLLFCTMILTLTGAAKRIIKPMKQTREICMDTVL
jgi:hypothetical protein